MLPLFICKDRQTLHDGSRRFDTRKLAWVALDVPVSNSESVTPIEAIRWLYAEAGARLVPVGVIGPREATEQQATRMAVSRALARPPPCQLRMPYFAS